MAELGVSVTWEANGGLWKTLEGVYDNSVNTKVKGKRSKAIGLQVQPNPFNPNTYLKFKLTKIAKINIRIYDLQGNLIKSLFEGSKIVGEHQVLWDGKNWNGNLVPSGVYVIRLETDNWAREMKAIIIK